MEKLQRIIDIFKKGMPVLGGLIEAGRNKDAREAATALLVASGDEPTDVELDAVDATLDRLLDEFNAPMKPRPA